MPAAPAPAVASFTSPIFLPTISSALYTAAPTMIAVPCWSSWKTGMCIRSRSLRSTMKHSGALMSSRLMPPKVGSSEAMMSTSLSGSRSSISMSNTSMPANFWNSTPLPSITGLPASGPMSPRPSTAVPLVITATRLPRAVISLACVGIGDDRLAGVGHAGRIGQRQVALGHHRLGGDDLDLPARLHAVVVERGLLEVVGHAGRGAGGVVDSTHRAGRWSSRDA